MASPQASITKPYSIRANTQCLSCCCCCFRHNCRKGGSMQHAVTRTACPSHTLLE